MRPRVILSNVASMDGRFTVAPGVDLLAGDERWTVMMADLADPYAWPAPPTTRRSSSKAAARSSTPSTRRYRKPNPAPPEGEHCLPEHVVGAPGRRFALVDGAGAVDLQFTEWPDPAWAGWHTLHPDLPWPRPPNTSPCCGSEASPTSWSDGDGWLCRTHSTCSASASAFRPWSPPAADASAAHCSANTSSTRSTLELLPWAIGGRGTPPPVRRRTPHPRPMAHPARAPQLETTHDRVRPRYRVMR